MDELTMQQELFCKYYTSKGSLFDNATLAYAEAYQYDLPKDDNGKIIVESREYNTCSALGSRLLTNDKVKARIQALYLELLNDNTMDARLGEIAVKGKDTDSIQALKIYNDLKQRITKKIDITSAGRPLGGLTDDELDKLAE